MKARYKVLITVPLVWLFLVGLIESIPTGYVDYVPTRVAEIILVPLFFFVIFIFLTFPGFSLGGIVVMTVAIYGIYRLWRKSHSSLEPPKT